MYIYLVTTEVCVIDAINPVEYISEPTDLGRLGVFSSMKKAMKAVEEDFKNEVEWQALSGDKLEIDRYDEGDEMKLRIEKYGEIYWKIAKIETIKVE